MRRKFLQSLPDILEYTNKNRMFIFFLPVLNYNSRCINDIFLFELISKLNVYGFNFKEKKFSDANIPWRFPHRCIFVFTNAISRNSDNFPFIARILVGLTLCWRVGEIKKKMRGHVFPQSATMRGSSLTGITWERFRGLLKLSFNTLERRRLFRDGRSHKPAAN